MRAEILRWLSAFVTPPAMTYIVHGEPRHARRCRPAIGRELGPVGSTRRHLERSTIWIRLGGMMWTGT